MESLLNKITKKAFFVFTIITLISFYALGQKKNGTPHSNIIKISPFTFLKGQIPMVHFERVVYGNLTASIGVAPILFGPLIGSLVFPPDKFNGGIAVDPELRWYAKSDKVMDGFYFGFYNSYRSSKWESSVSAKDIFKVNTTPDLKVSSTKLIGGIHFGTQRMLGEHFAVDVNGGIGFSRSKTFAKEYSSQKLYDKTTGGGVNLKLGISLGWRF